MDTFAPAGALPIFGSVTKISPILFGRVGRGRLMYRVVQNKWDP